MTNIIDMALSPFISLMGPTFFAFLIFGIAGALFIKTKSSILVAVLLIISIPFIATILPVESHSLLFVVVALAIAGLIYKLLRGRVME